MWLLMSQLSELDSLFFTMSLLCGNDTTIILCQEDRPGTDAFQDSAQSHGLVVKQVGKLEFVMTCDSLKLPFCPAVQLPEEHLHPDWRSDDIHIYIIRKKPEM